MDALRNEADARYRARRVYSLIGATFGLLPIPAGGKDENYRLDRSAWNRQRKSTRSSSP